MAFQPVPGVVSCAIDQRLFGQQVVNTLAFTAPLTLDTSTLSLLAATLLNSWRVNVHTVLSSDLQLEGCRVYAQEASDSPVGTAALSPSVAGGEGSASQPGNVALCVKFTTGGRGRSSRGRLYLGGIPENQVVGNEVILPFAAAALSGLEAVFVSMAGLGVFQAVISRYSAGVRRPVGIYRTVAARSLTDRFIDSQRGRLTGRGN